MQVIIILNKIAMKKTKNYQRNHQADSKSYQPSEGTEAENPNVSPDNPLLTKPEKSIPVKQDLDNRRSVKNRPHMH